MSKQREKEIKQLMYLKEELLKQTKKELKALSNELRLLEANKHNEYRNVKKFGGRK